MVIMYMEVFMKKNNIKNWQIKISQVLFLLAIPIMFLLPFVQVSIIKIIVTSYVFTLFINGITILLLLLKKENKMK